MSEGEGGAHPQTGALDIPASPSMKEAMIPRDNTFIACLESSPSIPWILTLTVVNCFRGPKKPNSTSKLIRQGAVKPRQIRSLPEPRQPLEMLNGAYTLGSGSELSHILRETPRRDILLWRAFPNSSANISKTFPRGACLGKKSRRFVPRDGRSSTRGAVRGRAAGNVSVPVEDGFEVLLRQIC